jgi:protocadherin Fat 1/2/3
VDRDVGQNGEIRYELVRGDGDVFSVEARTGRMVLKRALGADRTSYEVVVAAYDGGAMIGNSFPRPFYRLDI